MAHFTVGLITEYNPFHNGHKYHMKQAKKITGASHVIVVMSGNYVQRGTPAITDKYTRTAMALQEGADLVFELPVSYACASAEIFAYGAISILHSLGFIDTICYGTEYPYSDEIRELARILFEEPLTYQNVLNAELKKGLSFPAARQKALSVCIADTPSLLRYKQLLSSPNAILGIEYEKALLSLNSPIQSYPLKRIGSDYNDTNLATENIYNSASSLRKIYEETQVLSSLSEQMPSSAFRLLKEANQKTSPITANDFSFLLYYKLLQTNAETLCQYTDVSPELANRIKYYLPQYKNFTQFAQLLKSKTYTQTRINRCLIHILLEMKEPAVILKEYTPYLRLLGFRKESSFLLRKREKEILPAILTKTADATSLLKPDSLHLFEKEVEASRLYYQLLYSKYGTIFPDDYRQSPVIL